jgi:hypothetical protein
MAGALTEILNNLFAHYVKMKMLHFQTGSYAWHKATDDYISKFLKQFDLLSEVAQGKYGRVQARRLVFSVATLSDSEAVAYLFNFANYLSGDLTRSIDDMRVGGDGVSDLLTIRDQMLTDTNQLIYLMSFR